MSSYFDALARQVREARETFDEDDAYFDAVAEIEEGLARDVSLAAGDREFPDDLRERMMTTLATKGVYQPPGLPPNQAARERARFGTSEAVEDLHELFHELARRRIATRFCGSLPDSPAYIVALRADHEE